CLTTTAERFGVPPRGRERSKPDAATCATSAQLAFRKPRFVIHAPSSGASRGLANLLPVRPQCAAGQLRAGLDAACERNGMVAGRAPGGRGARAEPDRAPRARAPPAAPAPAPAPPAEASLPGTLPIVTDQFATVTVVPNEEIRRSTGGTLGDMLFAKPGITGSSFAPGASSRPIIRGLD